MIFLDTSVLVAAFIEGHPHHAASFKLFSRASRQSAACSGHALAEFYATMSALPQRPALEPDQVNSLVLEIVARLKVVTLDEKDYLRAVRQTSDQGWVSGRIYDALHLACAEKARANILYTWNLKHFKPLSAASIQDIRTP